MSLFTVTDNGWRTALDLAAAGIRLGAVVDRRGFVAAHLTEAARRVGAQIFLGADIAGVQGGSRVRAVEVSTDGRNALPFKCDALAVSGGFNPSLGLTSHLGRGRNGRRQPRPLCRATCHPMSWWRARRAGCSRWPIAWRMARVRAWT